jgi:methyl-accepting chemotaxis protein
LTNKGFSGLIKLFGILVLVFGTMLVLTEIIENLIFSIVLVVLFSGIIAFIINKVYNANIDDIKYYLNCINKNDLMINTNKKGQGINVEIISEIEEMLEGMKKNFKQQVNISTKISGISEQINAISTETQTAMESIASSAEITSQNSENQFQMMNQVSEKTESIVNILNNTKQEMEATVEFTSQSINSTQEGIKATSQVQEKISITRQLVKDNADRVNDLRLYSEEVVKLIDLINSISQQTNMLSLNASIEAARAGEQGKGFAVVASEVSKLAKETGEVSARIEDVISTLKNDIASISESMQQETNQVEESYFVIQKTMNDFSKIEESLNTSINKIKRMNSSISEVNESGREIQSSIYDVTSFTREISSQMQETTAQVIVQNEKMSMLQSIIKELHETSDSMQQYVTSKVMEGKMLRDVEYIQKEIKRNSINDDLIKRLLKEIGADVIYLSDKNGEVKYCNEKESIGLNLYQVDESYSALKNGQATYIATPVKKRVEDGKLFKFLAVIDETGIIYQIGLSIESLMKF